MPDAVETKAVISEGWSWIVTKEALGGRWKSAHVAETQLDQGVGQEQGCC